MTILLEDKWIDISQPLTNSIGTWPGDTPFQFELSFTKEQTGSVNLGSMTTSLHTGTHIDAPFHFDNEGKQVHELDINLYIGPARVIELFDVQTIDVAHLKSFQLEGVKRLLFKTVKGQDTTKFKEKFPLLTPAAVTYLAQQGVQLIGIDAPSVDDITSKELTIHHTLHTNGIAILENIMLTDVTPGEYEFIALPLHIVGADGSPVRAVLRKL